MGRVSVRVVLVVALAASGCSLLVGEELDGKGGTDSGVPDGVDAGPLCAGASDGSECGSGLICIAESCAASRCGDGYVDAAAGEECEDGNNVPGDGCEPDLCVYSCTAPAQCNDANPCNGEENCESNRCTASAAPGNGTACVRDGEEAGVCRGDECVAAGCGNGVLDAEEVCDDGNMDDGDGCDTDCTFSCVEDVDCADGDVCNGSETCNVEMHTCVAGTPEDCTDDNPCTADECDPVEGCANPLIDEDNDGHAPDSLGACGDDCNDANATVFTGAEELCDAVDNNCNGMTDETAPTWYIDCDDDGYAVDTSASRMGCEEPASSLTGCGGGWTTLRPVTAGVSIDCNDGNADVHPNQRRYFGDPIPGAPSNLDYDYDCDGSEQKQWGCALFDCTTTSTGCSGSSVGYTEGCTVPAGCSFCFPSVPPPCGSRNNNYRSSCVRILSSCGGPSGDRQQLCH